MKLSHWSRSARLAVALALFAAPVQAQLPTGDELHAKSLKAIGGADVVRKHTAMHVTGEFEIPAQGMKGSVEVWSMVPDRFLSLVEIPGIGQVKSGYDGTTGWSMNPMMGAQIATGKELAQIKEQADMHSALHPERWIKARQTVEKTTFDGKPAYKVKVTPIEGGDYFEFYDADSGLELGSIRSLETPMGTVEQTTTVSDYQNIDGQLIPMKLKQSMAGMDQLITFKKVVFAPLDPALFELPKEIKALVK